jgi:hypothetical protein
MHDDMKFLFDQLQKVNSFNLIYPDPNLELFYLNLVKVKLQRDESWSRNRFLESKMQTIHGHVKEVRILVALPRIFCEKVRAFRYSIRGFCRNNHFLNY